jgi:hypothetical protein
MMADAEVSLLARIGADVTGALGGLGQLGEGIKGMAAKAASALVAVGLAKFADDSIKVAEKAQLSVEQMTNTVNNALTSGSKNASAAMQNDAQASASATDKAAAALDKYGVGSAQYKAAADKAHDAEAKLADDRRNMAELNTQTGKTFATYATQITDSIAAESDLSSFTKGDLRQAFTGLVGVTGNVQQSLKLTNEAADLSAFATAAGKSMSLGQAGILLGKVYDGNTTALQRFGITIPKGATAMEALHAVQLKTAGSAKTFGDSEVGTNNKLKNAYTDLQVAVGTALLPALRGATTWLTNTLDGFNKLPGPVKSIIIGIVGVAAAIGILAPWISTIATIVGLVQSWGLITKAATVFQWLFNVAMDANPVALVVIGIVALIAVIVLLVTHWKAVVEWVTKAWDAVSKFVGGVGSAIGNFFTGGGSPSPGKGYASGGVLSGPSSGYGVSATFHGDEVIAPLSGRIAPSARPALAQAAANNGIGGGGSTQYGPFVFPGVTSRSEANGIANKVNALIGGTGAPVMDFGG